MFRLPRKDLALKAAGFNNPDTVRLPWARLACLVIIYWTLDPIKALSGNFFLKHPLIIQPMRGSKFVCEISYIVKLQKI